MEFNLIIYYNCLKHHLMNPFLYQECISKNESFIPRKFVKEVNSLKPEQLV